jgi:hypothetical protein
MTKKQFDWMFEGINCPEYRGARAPQFNPYAINEAEFEDNLRFKEYKIKFYPKTQNVNVEWKSQEDCSIHDRFDIELIRVFKNVMGISGNINVTLYSRDNDTSVEVYTL